MIQDWWGDNPLKPIRELLPDTTYIISENNEDVACGCLYLTNCKYACLIENVISNPKVKSEFRKKSVARLIKHLEQEAKSQGYKAVSLFSTVDKLKLRWVELGFAPIQNNITTFSKFI